jgi:SAM-dependent methyltransferase
MQCRVCSSATSAAIFHSPPRSVIAIAKPIDSPLNVYACEVCGHGQSDDIDFDLFYDRDYQFQLTSLEHDQLHAVVDGKNVFRSDLQAKIVLEMVDFPDGARILDYGAAKASTLRKICDTRPDLVAYVFDVSKDYDSLWGKWIPKERQASYQIPAQWKANFDVVTAYFVLEHVDKPNEMVAAISEVLRSSGKLFLIVPNPIENYSDFAVIEHVNHFTRSSLYHLLDANGFHIEQHTTEKFFGAHVVVARKMQNSVCERPEINPMTDFQQLRTVADFWNNAQTHVREVAGHSLNRPCAIYGAGVYGSYIATRLEGYLKPLCFVDRNPHLWGPSEFGIPIVAPENLPSEVEMIFAGVNPFKARAILKDVPEWRNRAIEIVYLDGDGL